jgi:hypothetical protein
VKKGLDLDRVVLLGRTFEEYVRCFALAPAECRGKRILDVGAGVSSFCAEANARSASNWAVVVAAADRLSILGSDRKLRPFARGPHGYTADPARSKIYSKKKDPKDQAAEDDAKDEPIVEENMLDDQRDVVRMRDGIRRLIEIARRPGFVEIAQRIAIGAGSDRLFRNLCGILGHPEWADRTEFGDNTRRVANQAKLAALIEGIEGERASASLLSATTNSSNSSTSP